MCSVNIPPVLFQLRSSSRRPKPAASPRHSAPLAWTGRIQPGPAAGQAASARLPVTVHVSGRDENSTSVKTHDTNTRSRL